MRKKPEVKNSLKIIYVYNIFQNWTTQKNCINFINKLQKKKKERKKNHQRKTQELK